MASFERFRIFSESVFPQPIEYRFAVGNERLAGDGVFLRKTAGPKSTQEKHCPNRVGLYPHKRDRIKKEINALRRGAVAHGD